MTDFGEEINRIKNIKRPYLVVGLAEVVSEDDLMLGEGGKPEYVVDKAIKEKITGDPIGVVKETPTRIHFEAVPCHWDEETRRIIVEGYTDK